MKLRLSENVILVRLYTIPVTKHISTSNYTPFILYAHKFKLLSVLECAQVPSIQQSAALALGRLANHSDDLAEDVVANEILPQLVYSLGEQNVRRGRV